MVGTQQLYKPGTLGRLNDSRSIPEGREGDSLPDVTTMEIAGKVLTLHYIKQHKLSQAQSNTIFAYHISKFYQETGKLNADMNQLIVSILGIIANCMDASKIATMSELTRAINLAGIDIKYDGLTYDEFVKNIIAKDSRVKLLIDLWGAESLYMLDDSKTMFIISCFILVAMVKNLTEGNYENWVSSRFIAFAKTVADNWSISRFSRSKYPDLTQLQCIHTAMSANYDLRRQIFKLIVALGKRQDGYISNGLREVFNLFKGVEMHHLVLIDTYIMSDYAELKGYFHLNGLEERFAAAVGVLSSLKASDVMYARFLLSKDEAQALNRNNFTSAIVMATQIARKKSSTYDNYYESDNLAHVAIRRLVDRYFEIREKTALFGVGENRRANLAPLERSEYMKLATKQLSSDITTTDLQEEGHDLVSLPTGMIKNLTTSGN